MLRRMAFASDLPTAEFGVEDDDHHCGSRSEN